MILYVSRDQFMSMFLSAGKVPVNVRVMAYILKFAPPENPVLIDSASKIAEYFQCSTSAVTKALNKLQSENLITRVQNGVWAINYENISKKRSQNTLSGSNNISSV